MKSLATRYLQRPLVQAAASFVVVVLVYSVYASCAVPWIEPPRALVSPESEPVASVNPLPSRFRSLFAADAWEHSSRFRLQTRDALVLAHNLEQLGSQRVRITPCTVIWESSSTSEASSVTLLHAAEGAELMFDATSDLQVGTLGQVETAELRGPVQVQRLRRVDGASEVFIRTSNVHMDTQRIWTADDVAFRWRGSEGLGRGLVINLHDARRQASAPDDSSTFDRIRSLALDQLDHLRVELDSKEPDGTVPLRRAPTAVRPHWLDVRCRGRMWIDFDQSVATLDQDVNVFHHGDDELAEQLSCDSLSLYFQGGKRVESESVDSGPIPRLVIDQAVAVGHPVIADIPAQKAWARCDRLVYFPAQQQLVLESQSAAPVEVQHAGKQFRVPRRVEYSWLSANRPRHLRVDGPGSFAGPLHSSQANSGGVEMMTATWSEGLTMVRNEDQLQVTFNADWSSEARVPPVVMTADGLGELQAGQVEFTLRDRAPEALVAGAPNPSGELPLELEPLVFKARHATTFQSPQLNLRCQLFEGEFVTPTVPSGTTDLNSVVGPQIGPAARSDPSSADPLPVPGRTRLRTESPEDRWKVMGHSVRMELSLLAPGNWTPTHTAVQGAVDVQRTTDDSTQQPLQFRGDELTFRHPQQPDGFVHLVGRPARIDWGETILQADQTHWQNDTGLVHIPGPGTLWLPARTIDAPRDAAPRSGATPQPFESTSPFADSGPIEVRWDGNLEFDGRRAILRGGRAGVLVQTQNELQRLRADQCEVTLTQSLLGPLREGNRRSQPRAEVERLKAIGNVYIENHTVEQQRRTAIDMARLPDLELNQMTGEVLASGPGWVSHTGYRSSDSPFQLVSAADATTAVNEPSLMYVRVEFQQRLSGGLQRRNVTFTGDVETIYGPVPGWGDVIDIDSPAGMAPEDVWLGCQQLSIDQAPRTRGEPDQWEVQATGNVRLRADRVTAEGDRLAYSQPKDRVLLEGSARRDAILKQRDAKTGATQVFQSRQVQYFPKTQQFQGEFQRVDLGRVPGASLPSGLP